MLFSVGSVCSVETRGRIFGDLCAAIFVERLDKEVIVLWDVTSLRARLSALCG